MAAREPKPGGEAKGAPGKARSETFRAPVGTRDVIFPESSRWERLVAEFARRVEAAGYGLVISPVFEDVGVFVRGVGETTDVVSKEMYVFEDKGGRRLALRPEGTASVVRAFVQHRPPLVWKAWYVAPAFRYERPQSGRYRQHHQVGVEALGTDDPDLDVEVLSLASAFVGALGLKEVALRLNSMGDGACRPAYLEALTSYLESVESSLCDEHRERWRLNPLRVLDCKREVCRSATERAPRLLDHLCGPCAEHLSRVRQGLDELGVEHEIDHRMVRGLDYYTRTAFELTAASLEQAQDVVGGGGRYNRLVEALGGPPVPGIGFGMGVERLLLACDAEGAWPERPAALDAFVVDRVGGRAARSITHELREAGLGADRAFGDRSMKAQLKLADRSGANVAVIVGPDEEGAGKVALRSLRGQGGQELVSREDVVACVRRASRR